MLRLFRDTLLKDYVTTRERMQLITMCKKYLHFYCPPTKFRSVSLSVHRRRGRGSHVTITHDALDLTLQIPPNLPCPPYPFPTWDLTVQGAPPPQTWGLTAQPPPLPFSRHGTSLYSPLPPVLTSDGWGREAGGMLSCWTKAMA